ncbi:hypothetical protein JYQ62_22815 [Nostoc sp. UHCC 0702]|nr:hypothetical protein JYQ62_22815 [Nostoc sp. UHCC 0702]
MSFKTVRPTVLDVYSRLQPQAMTHTPRGIMVTPVSTNSKAIALVLEEENANARKIRTVHASKAGFP